MVAPRVPGLAVMVEAIPFLALLMVNLPLEQMLVVENRRRHRP